MSGSRGSWIPWLFVGLFGVVVAVNGTMIWIAGSTWTGVTTDDAFEKGLDYNRNLEAQNTQAALGWRVTIEAELDEGFEGRLTLTLQDSEGASLDDAEVAVTFERPTHEGLDFTVLPEPVGGGRYEAGLAVPLAGAWNAHTVARRGDAVFVHDSRLFLR